MANQEKPPKRTRDKVATRESLIRAVGRLLAREGFSRLGVNAVAREAGVDKVLIYRYFGGLPQLMAAYGREGDFWPTADEMLGGLDLDRETVAAALVAGILDNFLIALRKRPITLEILAWEVVERNELTIELEKVREKVSREMMGRLLAGNGTGRWVGRDWDALGAILGSALTYLAIRASRGTQEYNGVELDTDRGWTRLRRTVSALIEGFAAAGV